jgi:hypothetical protein
VAELGYVAGRELESDLDAIELGGRVTVAVEVAVGKLGVAAPELDWVGGDSLVLPGGVAAMVVVGPVIRWSDQ